VAKGSKFTRAANGRRFRHQLSSVPAQRAGEVYRKMRQILGREPTREEIAAAFAKAKERRRAARANAKPVLPPKD
jgi:DNA-directed RNA polymerase specialized sigma subunit